MKNETRRVEAEIDARTRLFGVIGNPVSHSLSPVMHNAAFRELGLNAVYLAFKVVDPEAAVEGIRVLGLSGVSVTIPHKVAVMDHLDEIDKMAHKIGAVNTILNRDGALIGMNTDCSGAVQALKQKTDIDGRETVIIGAGGAARAIAFGLLKEQARVTIANRSAANGQKLAGELDIGYCPLNDGRLAEADIIINTTPVGMTGHAGGMPVAKEIFGGRPIVMDIIYNPLETEFLKAARKAGCGIINGLPMFVFQGAHQFSLWTGIDAPVETMEAAVRGSL